MPSYQRASSRRKQRPCKTITNSSRIQSPERLAHRSTGRTVHRPIVVSRFQNQLSEDRAGQAGLSLCSCAVVSLTRIRWLSACRAWDDRGAGGKDGINRRPSFRSSRSPELYCTASDHTVVGTSANHASCILFAVIPTYPFSLARDEKKWGENTKNNANVACTKRLEVTPHRILEPGTSLQVSAKLGMNV